MTEPFDVSRAKLALASADLLDALAEAWGGTFGKWVGPSKFPRWSMERRVAAWGVLFSWPESQGGWVADAEFDTPEPAHQGDT